MLLPEHVNPEVILVRYGEIALKASYTRKVFEQRLIKNISDAFSQRDIDCHIENQWGRLLIYSDNIEESLRILEKIFGITSVSPAEKTSADVDSISKNALALMNSLYRDQSSFALRVRRSGEHSFSSLDIARIVGKKIDEKLPVHVDLTNPDIELFIEIRGSYAYLFIEKFRGPGGMPQGTQGAVLGYIDSVQSLLASWYLLKRGCSIIFFIKDPVFFGNTREFVKKWFIRSKIIKYENDKEIWSQINDIIRRYHCSAMVSGFSFGSDQKDTIETIKAIHGEISVPLLLPLISLNHDLIGEKARSVGLPL
jgi:thiamine biosynthesis protein ThiI